MPDLNAHSNGTTAGPDWYFLTEFSLSEFLSDHDRRDAPAEGVLFRTAREAGIPVETVETIEMTLAGFAREALDHLKQGKPVIPGPVRVYWQKKVKDEVHLARATPIERAAEPVRAIPDPGAKTVGGWGFFLIERGANERAGSSAGASAGSRYSVDLYLYKEGE